MQASIRGGEERFEGIVLSLEGFGARGLDGEPARELRIWFISLEATGYV
jgi:hypothetical protein